MIMKDLNEKQAEAALQTEGPLLILAGAGSGKTKTLTSRIAFLIQELGVAPHRILAVTFTNKAAQEMRDRVARTLRENGSMLEARHLPDIGTFHSICTKILRREMSSLPFTKPFVIYDDSDQLSLVKQSMKRLNIDDKVFSPKSMQAIINRAKCDALSPAELEAEPFDIASQKAKKVYEHYQQSLIAANAVDFGEILSMTYRLFRDNAEVRNKYQALYRYIHVDEYQDTNRVQYLILKLLAHPDWGGHKNLCVVGDEDQSIYKWRGADIRNILDFEIDYPDAVVVKLEQNYRSTKNVIRAAGAVIRNNLTRKDKTLWTANSDGELLRNVQLLDERAEAQFVIQEIKRLAQNEGHAFGDFAIFYRTNAQSRQFEDLLRREKIAYQIVGGFRFYERKEVKDVLSYFRAILNPADSVSMKRVINTPARGIGKTTIEKIDALQAQMVSDGNERATFWDALVLAAQDASLTSAATAKKLANFTHLLEKLMGASEKLTLPELYHRLLDETAMVLEFKKEGTDESLARIENLEELDTVLQEFIEASPDLEPHQQLATFIEQSTLAAEVDELQSEISSVKLMTLHSSKGLEFPVVFLVGMEEGLFPSIQVWEDEELEDIEEERRLCYVGMTRAEKTLVLTHVIERRIWGKLQFQKPSRFLDEIPGELMMTQDLVRGASHASAYGARSFGQGGRLHETSHRSSSSVPSEDNPLVGLKLNHPEYGVGKIQSTEGFGPNQRVTVEFSGRVHRKFLVRFVENYIQRSF